MRSVQELARGSSRVQSSCSICGRWTCDCLAPLFHLYASPCVRLPICTIAVPPRAIATMLSPPLTRNYERVWREHRTITVLYDTLCDGCARSVG